MRAWLLAVVVLLGCDRRGPSEPAPSTKAPPRPVAAAPTPTTANDNAATPLLWVVHSDAGANRIYLLGTMHIGIDADRHVPAVVFDLLAEARTFVMEADLSGVAPGDVIALAELPAGESLGDALTPKQWRHVAKLMPRYPEDRLRRMRPWFIVIAIAQSMLPYSEAMDTVLLRRARNAGLDTAFLEGWRYQLAIVDEVTRVADLVDVLENFDDTKQDLHDLAAAYRAGDADAIAKILFDPEQYVKNPKMIDVLLTRRNKEWLPALEKHIDRGGVFVAVGVGHLIGDEGVVALLRKRGYRVERFTNAQPAPVRTPAHPAVPASGAR